MMVKLDYSPINAKGYFILLLLINFNLAIESSNI